MNSLLKCDFICKEPRDAQQSTPLHLAAIYNQPKIAQILLEEGEANLRALDSDHRTPIHEACQEGNEPIAKFLLESAQKQDETYGSNITKSMCQDQDDDGATPLLLGVAKGGTKIVELLLEHGANPNQHNRENVYPVHSAARFGDLDTLKMLCVTLHPHLFLSFNNTNV